MPSHDAPTSLRTVVDGRALQLTNLDRVLFPDGTTKAEVVSYLLAVAPVMLPHLAGRCLTRRRFPQGSAEHDDPSIGFYEKNLPPGAPDWVATQLVQASGVDLCYPLADSPATLVWLANLAALELHTPQWRVDDQPGTSPTTPLRLDEEAGGDLVLADRMVLDLDPGPGTTMADSARAAMLVATELAQAGLVPHVKTSGSKGLQVVAALQPTPWPQVVAWVQQLAQLLARRHPDEFVAVMAKQQRPERVFVDYLQNRAARNTIAPYSLRGRARPSCSTPVTWEEVAAAGPDSLRFTADDVLARIEEHGDLWAELLDPALAAPLPSW